MQVVTFRWNGVVERRRCAILRHAALVYAAHQWPVVPGACAVGGHCDCGEPRCFTAGLHPLWQTDPDTESAQVHGWWAHSTRPILLPTGTGVDVIELPAWLGPVVHARLEQASPGRTGPVALVANPNGARWLFFCEPGAGLRPELVEYYDILLHGTRSWVPAPPSRLPGDGRATWHRAPWLSGWRLADARAVQEQVVAVGTRERAAPH